MFHRLVFSTITIYIINFDWYISIMGVGSGGAGGPWPPWIFMHGTNIVDRGLKVLFFGLFCHFSVFFCWSPLWKKLNSAIF